MKQETLSILKSGKYGGHKYRDALRYDITSDSPIVKAKAWAGSKYYPLTHLLEKGHNIKRAGKIVGSTRAYPHWEPAKDYVEKELFNLVEKGLSNIK
jgi:hypothetical protein